MTTPDDETRELIQEHHAELRALADSDLPANWVARRLLEAVDE